MADMKDHQVEQLVDTKLNEVVKVIQDSIGVESGDEAAWYFNGIWEEMTEKIKDRMIKYRDHEIAMRVE